MSNNPLVCPKCGGGMSFMVQQVIRAPGHMYHNLTRHNMRSKDCRSMGTLWETAYKICDVCHYVIDGYGNYVTRMARDLERAKKTLVAHGFVDRGDEQWTPPLSKVCLWSRFLKPNPGSAKKPGAMPKSGRPGIEPSATETRQPSSWHFHGRQPIASIWSRNCEA